MTGEQMDDGHKERMAICRALADQIGDFADFITRRAGMEPVDLLISLTTATLELNKRYAKPGKEMESFENLISGMRSMQEHLLLEEDAAEAMEEAAQARERGAMQ